MRPRRPQVPRGWGEGRRGGGRTWGGLLDALAPTVNRWPVGFFDYNSIVLDHGILKPLPRFCERQIVAAIQALWHPGRLLGIRPMNVHAGVREPAQTHAIRAVDPNGFAVAEDFGLAHHPLLKFHPQMRKHVWWGPDISQPPSRERMPRPPPSQPPSCVHAWQRLPHSRLVERRVTHLPLAGGAPAPPHQDGPSRP